MKKLYKSERNRMISGVCGGVADYFGIDPTLVRVGTVVIGLLMGGGFPMGIAYIVCSCILPNESQVKGGGD